MENIDLIALLLTIIAVFVAIWIFRRVLIIVAILIVIGVLAYFFLQNNPDFNSGRTFKHNGSSLLESFKDNYCGLLYDRDDSLFCYYIVTPIYNDIVNSYDLDSVNSLNQKQFIQLLIEVSKRHKKEILHNLSKYNALYLWKDFILDIKENAVFDINR